MKQVLWDLAEDYQEYTLGYNYWTDGWKIMIENYFLLAWRWKWAFSGRQSFEDLKASKFSKSNTWWWMIFAFRSKKIGDKLGGKCGRKSLWHMRQITCCSLNFTISTTKKLGDICCQLSAKRNKSLWLFFPRKTKLDLSFILLYIILYYPFHPLLYISFSSNFIPSYIFNSLLYIP